MTDMALSGPGRRRWQSIVYFVSAQRGILLAIAIFAVMFGLYGWKQEVGLTANIINTAANKGALLALIAMAQTIPVLTGGLDLSVGMIFLLTNCLASVIVNGDPNPDRPDLPHYGAGETVCKPTIAAVANAIYDATGVRLRRVPFRPARVLAALKQAGV